MNNITFKVSDNELESLNNEATRKGITTSELVRRKVFIEVEIEAIVKDAVKTIEDIVKDFMPKPKKSKKEKETDE